MTTPRRRWFRYSLRVGSVLLWASVVVIPLGTHYQVRSPHFAEYEHQFIADMIAANPGKDLGPNMYFLAFTWPFVACGCFFVCLLFTSGVTLTRLLSRWSHGVGLIATVAFALCCIVGAVLGFGAACDSLKWGFGVLALGYMLSAGGLLLGGAGACPGLPFTKHPVPGP